MNIALYITLFLSAVAVALMIILIIQHRKIAFLASEQEKQEKRITDQIRYLQEIINQSFRADREELSQSMKLLSETLDKSIKNFGEASDKGLDLMIKLIKDKLSLIENRQNEMVDKTELKLEKIRITVEEKLEKTLSERLGQSFETVGKQLIEVQKGLGDMRTLAQDVGGLKGF